MGQIFSSPNIYTVLWLIQILNSRYNFISDTLSVLELYVILAWSLTVIFKGFIESIYQNLKPLNIFLCLLTIYGLIRIVTNEDLYIYGINRLINSRYFIISHWSSILPIYVFYYYAAKGKITEIWIRNWSLLFVASALAVYFATQRKSMIMDFADPNGFTNNSSYLVLSLFPVLLFWRDNNLVKYSLIALILIVVLLCMKRGAILIAAVMLLYFFKDIMSNGSIHTKIINVVLACVLISLGISFIGNMMDTNDYFMQRINDTIEGNSSGRDSLYERLWKYMTEQADIVALLIGLGADGTVKAIGQVAHNDWLEYFVDMGILGVTAFSYLWIRLYGLYRNFSGNHLYKLIFALILIFLFFRTLFSMSISDISLFTSCALGFCLYNTSKNYYKIWDIQQY